jgi:tRNA G46 methylase TrmB
MSAERDADHERYDAEPHFARRFRSQTFDSLYDAILAPLGFVRLWTDVDAAGYGYRGGDDEFALNSTRASFHFESAQPRRL